MWEDFFQRSKIECYWELKGEGAGLSWLMKVQKDCRENFKAFWIWWNERYILSKAAFLMIRVSFNCDYIININKWNRRTKTYGSTWWLEEPWASLISWSTTSLTSGRPELSHFLWKGPREFSKKSSTKCWQLASLMLKLSIWSRKEESLNKTLRLLLGLS